MSDKFIVQTQGWNYDVSDDLLKDICNTNYAKVELTMPIKGLILETFKDNTGCEIKKLQSPCINSITIKKLFSGTTIAEATKDPFAIHKVIYDGPATIVLWADGEKTIVKCQPNDIPDREKGLAMCFAKKALDNKGRYFEVFKKYAKESD